AASHTVATAPKYGSTAHARGFESTLSASPRRDPLMRKTAASLPGPTTVLPCTIESYCRKTQRFDPTFGLAISARSACAGAGVLCLGVGRGVPVAACAAGGAAGRS